MTDSNKNTTRKNTATATPSPLEDINPVAAGAVGAVVGAGVGIASAVAMKDEATRKKAEEVIKTVGQKAGEAAKEIKADANKHLNEKKDEALQDVEKTMTK